MNKFIRDFLIIVISLIISTFLSLKLDDFFMNTIFTVSGIMFSIGFGLIVTFNLQGIKKKSIIIHFRENLTELRNNYIKYFTLTTIVFVCDKYIREYKLSKYNIYISKKYYIQIDFPFFFFLIMMFCIVYYIYNFVALQKLNNEIYDELHKE